VLTFLVINKFFFKIRSKMNSTLDNSISYNKQMKVITVVGLIYHLCVSFSFRYIMNRNKSCKYLNKKTSGIGIQYTDVYKLNI